MKKFIYLSIVFLFPVISIYTTEIGIDTDTNDLKTLPIVPLLTNEDDSDITSLSHFGTSLFIKKSLDSSDRLLTALEKNPYSSRILAFLLRNFRNYKVPDIQIKTFIAIAKANPQALPLNVAALSLANIIKDKGSNPTKIKRELAEACVANSDPDKFNEIQFNLFANVIKTLSGIYLQDKEYDLGDELFEQILENKKIFKHNIFLQQAVFFYSQAAEKVDKSRRFLSLLPSHATLYSERKQELLASLRSRSEKIDGMKKRLKHLAFLQKVGLLDEGKDLLLKQLAEQPSQVSLQIALAELFSRQKKYALANALWQKLAKVKPNNKFFLFKVAHSAFSAQLYQLAADNFDKILQSSQKKNPSVIFVLILSKLQLGDPDIAWVLLKMLPDVNRYAEIRAHVANALEKHKEAFKILSKLISKSSRTPDSRLYFLWLALAVKAESPELQLKCLKVLEDKLDMKDTEVANAIGYTYADLNKNLPEAKKMISYALTKEAENAAYLDSMAWVLYRMKEFKLAATYIEKAMLQDGKYSNAILADHAGDIFYALGNKKKATHYWGLALKVFSYDLDRKKTIKKLKDLNG